MEYFDDLLDALRATLAARTPRIFAAVNAVRSILTGATEEDDIAPGSDAPEDEDEDEGHIAIHYTMTPTDFDGGMETTQDIDLPLRAFPDRGRSIAPSNSSRTRPTLQPDVAYKPDRSRSPAK